MSCCINYTAQIKKHDYNDIVFIFNIDAEMLHNVQQAITAPWITTSAVTQTAPTSHNSMWKGVEDIMKLNGYTFTPKQLSVGGRHWCLLINWSKTTAKNVDKALEKSLEICKAVQLQLWRTSTSRHALQTAKRNVVHLSFHFIFMLPYYM